MQFDKQLAEAMHERKIYLAYNSPPPTDTQYGWLRLPSDINVQESITLEERVALYAGQYQPSIGAPASHGFCSIGSFSYSYSPLPAGLKVGRYCSISAGLRFLDSHHPIDLLTTSALTFRPHNALWADLLEKAEVRGHGRWHVYNHKRFPVIGNDVWIAKDVVLAMGITIGDGAVIAANSVVTKDVAPYSVVGGNPGESKKIRFPNEIVHRLLVSKWWNKDPVVIARIAHLGLEASLSYLERNESEIGRFLTRRLILCEDGPSFEEHDGDIASGL